MFSSWKTAPCLFRSNTGLNTLYSMYKNSSTKHQKISILNYDLFFTIFCSKIGCPHFRYVDLVVKFYWKSFTSHTFLGYLCNPTLVCLQLYAICARTSMCSYVCACVPFVCKILPWASASIGLHFEWKLSIVSKSWRKNWKVLIETFARFFHSFSKCSA